MNPDTTSNSWKTNLFLVTASAAVTVALMTLYNRYQDSKKSQDVRAQKDAETQTNPIQMHQSRSAPRPLLVPQNERSTGAAKKTALMKSQKTTDIPLEMLLSYINNTPPVKMTTQRNINPKSTENAPSTTQTESVQPISPRGELPNTEDARLFGSRNSSYSRLSSRAPSVEDDLDRPRTPYNSEAAITAEEQERRGDQIFTAVAQSTKSAAEASSTEKSWKLWPLF